MIKRIYSILDKKALVYSNPFVSIRDEVAMRDFAKAINEPGNQLNDYPGDFDLFYLGQFDDEHGVIEICQQRFIQNGAFLKQFDAE